MDLLLIRHGEGEHTLDLPASLELSDPGLTETGRQQVLALAASLGISDDDLIVVSPTRRTMETAQILRGDSKARVVVTPEVGPRMFRVDRGWLPLPCDQLLPEAAIRAEFPDGELRGADLWPDGINTMSAEAFEALARNLLSWCAHQNARRTLIVTHDGTVYNYRKVLLNARDLPMERLGPAGHVVMSL